MPVHRCPRPRSGGVGGWKGLAWAGLRQEESIKDGILRSTLARRRGSAVLPAPLPVDARACRRARDPHFCVASVRPVGETWRAFGANENSAQLSTVDPSARASMKNAANCDT